MVTIMKRAYAPYALWSAVSFFSPGAYSQPYTFPGTYDSGVSCGTLSTVENGEPDGLFYINHFGLLGLRWVLIY
jgi:hypothetical protein